MNTYWKKLKASAQAILAIKEVVVAQASKLNHYDRSLLKETNLKHNGFYAKTKDKFFSADWRFTKTTVEVDRLTEENIKLFKKAMIDFAMEGISFRNNTKMGLMFKGYEWKTWTGKEVLHRSPRSFDKGYDTKDGKATASHLTKLQAQRIIEFIESLEQDVERHKRKKFKDDFRKQYLETHGKPFQEEKKQLQERTRQLQKEVNETLQARLKKAGLHRELTEEDKERYNTQKETFDFITIYMEEKYVRHSEGYYADGGYSRSLSVYEFAPSVRVENHHHNEFKVNEIQSSLKNGKLYYEKGNSPEDMIAEAKRLTIFAEVINEYMPKANEIADARTQVSESLRQVAKNQVDAWKAFQG